MKSTIFLILTVSSALFSMDNSIPVPELQEELNRQEEMRGISRRCKENENQEELLGSIQDYISTRIPSELTEKKIATLLQTAPERIRLLINDFNDPYLIKTNSLPQKLLFEGPPGCGKTHTAYVVALKTAKVAYKANATLLATEYKKSGAQNLRRIMQYICNQNQPAVLILDEITELTNRHKNKKDPDQGDAGALWTLLDDIADYPGLLIIGTSNDITKLPDPLKDRFNGGIVHFDFPDFATRQAIISSMIPADVLDETDIKWLTNKTKGRSARVIKEVINLAIQQARHRSRTNTVVTRQDMQDALNTLIRDPWFYKRLYKKIKPDSDGFKWLQFGTSQSIALAGLGISSMGLYLTCKQYDISLFNEKTMLLLTYPVRFLADPKRSAKLTGGIISNLVDFGYEVALSTGQFAQENPGLIAKGILLPWYLPVVIVKGMI